MYSAATPARPGTLDHQIRLAPQDFLHDRLIQWALVQKQLDLGAEMLRQEDRLGE